MKFWISLILGCSILGSCGAESVHQSVDVSLLPGESRFEMADLRDHIDQVIYDWIIMEEEVAACMRRQGFEYQPRTVEVTYPESAAVMTIIEFADTYGYGISFEGANRGPRVLITRSMRIGHELVDAYERAYFDDPGCGRDHPDPDIEELIAEQQFGALYGVDSETMDRILASSSYIAAERSWIECMRDAGFDYSHPAEPFSDLDGEFLANGGSDLEMIQARERLIAGADVRCKAVTTIPVILAEIEASG